MLKRNLLAVLVVATAMMAAGLTGVAQIREAEAFRVSLNTFTLVYDDTDWLSGSSDSWTYRGTLSGGVRYKFQLIVPFGADFDIKIYDENGNLVAKGTKTGSADETVYITPRWTGPFRIVVYSYTGSGFYTLKLYKKR